MTDRTAHPRPRTVALLAAAMVLTACGGAGTPAAPEAANDTSAVPASPPLRPPAPSSAARPAPAPPAASASADPAAAQPEPGSAADAAHVVRQYYALIEAGRYADAFALWRAGQPPMSADAFMAGFTRYARYHAAVGAPGRIDAGAGQRYIEVPVTLTGTLRSGTALREKAVVVLHRAGDIDGATAEQKSWRIERIDGSQGG